MLMTSHPADLNHAGSARVENRGPSMTTTVPRSCPGIRRSPPFCTPPGRGLALDLPGALEEGREARAAEDAELGDHRSDPPPLGSRPPVPPEPLEPPAPFEAGFVESAPPPSLPRCPSERLLSVGFVSVGLFSDGFESRVEPSE